LIQYATSAYKFAALYINVTAAPQSLIILKRFFYVQDILLVVHRSKPAFGESLSNSLGINSIIRVVENHCVIELRNTVFGLVLADVNESLLHPITKKSVLRTINGRGAKRKSLGMDGLSLEFCAMMWHISKRVCCLQ
jgi:hypothetical protein